MSEKEKQIATNGTEGEVAVTNGTQASDTDQSSSSDQVVEQGQGEEAIKRPPVFKTVVGVVAKIKNEKGLSPEEKVDTLCLLVQKIIEENTVLKSELGMMEDQMKKSTKATDAVKQLNEAYKKQVELVREEGELKLKEEASKRAECMTNYQTTMTELATLLETHTGQNSRLREENMGMADHLKSLLEEGTKREDKITNIITEYQLRIQLMEHQLSKAQIEKAEVKADLTKEKLEMYQEMELERERNSNLEETVRLLKEQSSLYQAQLDEATSGAGSTNKTIQHFKTQIEKLTQRMAELDKDTQQWRDRYETSSQQVKKMNTLSLEREKEVNHLKKKLESMIKLNHTLSNERKELLAKLSTQEENERNEG